MRLVFASLAVLALAACSKPQEAAAPAETPKPASYAYDIALSFTPAAVEKVTRRGDTVTIAALYYGNATAASASLADASDGTIHLNTDHVDVTPKDQTIHMTGEGVNTPNFDKIVEKKPLVQVTVIAMKAGKKDPVIACSVFQDYVTSAQAASPLKIRCDAA